MAVLTVCSVAVTFWKTMLVRDFDIVDDVEVESEDLEF
jgi:hypothetical protein